MRKGAHEVRDVQNIADILVDPEGARERRDHWEKTAHALLTGAILHVLYAEEEKTLARVATFLADPSRSILRTLKIMLTTNHVGTDAVPMAHPVVASIARELLNKSDNERSGVVSTAMSFLGLYRDPLIAATTARSDWRIADLMHAERPVSLYLVVPPSDISRTKPLVRLVLNQIARQLTETLGAVDGDAPRRRLLLMVDEFPALGRLDFFESSLAFLAGYGVRAFLVAQSLHQIDKAYGPTPRHPRQLPCARRLCAQRRAHRQAAVGRAWYRHRAACAEKSVGPALLGLAVAHLRVGAGNATPAADRRARSCSCQPMTPWSWSRACRRSAPASSGTTPTSNFLRAPLAGAGAARRTAMPTRRQPAQHDWETSARAEPDPRLEKSWSDLVLSSPAEDDPPARPRDIPAPQAQQGRSAAERPAVVRRSASPYRPTTAAADISDDDRTVQFPGLRL